MANVFNLFLQNVVSHPGLVELDTCSECSEEGDNGDSDILYATVELDTCSDSSEMDVSGAEATMDTIRDSITGCNCCSQCCSSTFNQLEIESIQSVFSLKAPVEQRQFILDQLILSPSVDSTFAQVIHLKFNGKKCASKHL